MEQFQPSAGASLDSADHRLDILSPTIASPKGDRYNSDEEVVSVINSLDGHDFTADLPDELLAHAFHFLHSGDRKTCSTICCRWLRVDGESRYRFYLKANSELLSSFPSIFICFDSFTELALLCLWDSASVGDEDLVLISMKCKRLTCLELRGCCDLTDLGIAGLTANCKTLRKLSCGSRSFGTKGINAVINFCVNLEEFQWKP